MPSKDKGRKMPWSPPEGYFSPSNPEEFKFCFALMGAASSGRMKVPTSRTLSIEGIAEILLTNTPFNRGMFAVSKHYNETHPREPDSPVPPELFALMNRLMALGDLISACVVEKKYPHMEKYLNRENEATKGLVGVAEPLIEAAASAPLGRYGAFKVESLLSIADKLAEEMRAVS